MKESGKDRQGLVRVNPEDKQALKSLALEEGVSMAQIIHRCIRAYSRQRFFEDLNRAYERLQENDELWQTEEEERKLWDQI